MNQNQIRQQEMQKEYHEIVEQIKPQPRILLNCLLAFIIGGLICVIGQVFLNYYSQIGLTDQEAGSATSATMVFLGAFLTGLGVYDTIGKYGGAGSIVPITGFANSIVAPAMEFKREGFVLGVGARMFIIAGPVLVYGFLASVIVGLIYFLFV